MQMKHLIIFAVVGMVALLGFNMMNGSQREKNRQALAINDSSALTNDSVSTTSANIASQPLGQQPKAILDDANAKINQAQQADTARLEQTSAAQ